MLADLKKAEETARAKGHAVVIATPAPHVLTGAQAVVAERDKDIRLVPLRLQPVEEETFASEDIPSERQDDPTSPIEH